MRWLRAFLMLSLTLALLPTHFIAAQTLAGEIVFTSDRDGGFIYEGNLFNKSDIYVMHTDGTDVHKLTDIAHDTSPANEDWNEDNTPAWSPDGTRIAFGRYNDLNMAGDIYVMYADGSSLTNITPLLDDEYSYTEPTWSPNGRQLRYVDRYGDFRAGTVEMEGSASRMSANCGRHPDWSPDGMHIVCVNDGYPSNDILVMAVDGSNEQNLTQGVGDNLDPVWSPDGTKIAFASKRNGSYDLYVMNADGSGVTQLMNNALEDREPAWSPDGTQLAFTRIFANNNAEIFVMNANGSNQHNISNNPGNDRHADWKGVGPIGSRTLLVSSNTDGKVDGVSFKDEDILAYDLQSQRWRIYFDGSDVGISKDVDGLGIDWNGTLLLSFNAATNVPGLGLISDADIVRFTPTQLGATTAGSFGRYFTGLAFALTTANEDIDAIGIVGASNKLVLSTVGNFNLSERGQFTGQDKDLFTITQWLDGNWLNIALDGSTIGLTTGKEDIGGVSYDNGVLYLSVLGTFAVPGVTGDGADIFKYVCNGDSCVFQPEWDGSAAGFGQEVIDAFEYVNMATPPVTAATIEDIGDDPYAGIDDEYADDEQGEAETFLPLVQR